MIRNLLLVAAGGALGAMLRYLMGLLGGAVSASPVVVTLVVNVVGSLAIGMLAAGCQSERWLLFATVGICGGFTTCSTFSLQTLTLLQQGRPLPAVLYAVGTVVLCVVCCFAGFLLGSHIKG